MSRHSEKLLELDKFIGHTITARRIALGLTTYELANMIGVTHQQIYKYENAINRVCASRLPDFAIALDLNIEEFFSEPIVIAPNYKRKTIININSMLFKLNKNMIDVAFHFVASLSRESK